MVTNFSKKVFWIMFVFFVSVLICASPLFAASQPVLTATVASKSKADYVPSVVYKGEYISNALYYKHNSKQPWMRWSKSDDYKQDMVCKEALAKLASAGFWAGNIAPKGACGTSAEPATFMLGNYLNYSASN